MNFQSYDSEFSFFLRRLSAGVNFRFRFRPVFPDRRHVQDLFQNGLLFFGCRNSYLDFGFLGFKHL